MMSQSIQECSVTSLQYYTHHIHTQNLMWLFMHVMLHTSYVNIICNVYIAMSTCYGKARAYMHAWAHALTTLLAVYGLT